MTQQLLDRHIGSPVPPQLGKPGGDGAGRRNVSSLEDDEDGEGGDNLGDGGPSKNGLGGRGIGRVRAPMTLGQVKQDRIFVRDEERRAR